MPKKAMEILTESMFYVLMALNTEPMCGIDIAAWVIRRTDGRVQLGPATLYTVLGKFEKEGYISETILVLIMPMMHCMRQLVHTCNWIKTTRR